MPTEIEDSGFLSRWSRRKVQVRQAAPASASAPASAPVAEPAAPVALAAVVTPAAAPGAQLPPTHLTRPAAGEAANSPAQVSECAVAQPTPPPPTLADVAALTRDSDYSPFMARGVQPDVKNAALGKLFTDPHFNVMDGLDVYIDDYGKPDPLPPGMLRQMLQSHVLGLFDDEDEKNKTTLIEAASAQACETAPLTTELPADENTDLQLQPDDGAGRSCLAPGAGQDAGCTH